MTLGGPMASSVLANAVKYAHDKGVVVVCAAGNDGRGKVSYPARYPGAIAVAATQFDETHDLLLELGQGDRHRGAGRQHPRRPERRRQPDGVLQNTIVPGDTCADRLPLVHGHVDGRRRTSPAWPR